MTEVTEIMHFSYHPSGVITEASNPIKLISFWRSRTGTEHICATQDGCHAARVILAAQGVITKALFLGRRKQTLFHQACEAVE